MKSVIDSLGLSIQELITILVPGASMCFFLSFIPLLKQSIIEIENKESWIFFFLFFCCTYFIGYTIYVLSSPLDSCYDRIKLRVLGFKNIDPSTDENLDYINPKKKINWFLNLLFPHIKDTHNLTVKVAKMKSKAVGFEYNHIVKDNEQGKDYKNVKEASNTKHYNLMNAYQYAFRRLMAEQPLMFEEVQRYYATAKFFRSMTVVLIGGSILWLINKEPTHYSLLLLGLSLVSFFVFLNRWRKANHVAYKNLIVIGDKELTSKIKL